MMVVCVGGLLIVANGLRWEWETEGWGDHTYELGKEMIVFIHTLWAIIS